MAPWLIEDINRVPQRVFNEHAIAAGYLAMHRSEKNHQLREIAASKVAEYEARIEERKREEQERLARLHEGYTR